MKILVERIATTPHSTPGHLHVNDTVIGYTLEDTFHDPKIPGETRIPDGTYKVRRRNIPGSKFDARYEQDLGAAYKGMFEVCDVPGFEDVLIHTGNTHADTEGCLLVGETQSKPGDDYIIGESLDMFKKLYPMLDEAWERGEEITITYKTS